MTIRRIREGDPRVISAALVSIGWDKPVSLYERYLREDGDGSRIVYVVEIDGTFAGYGTVVWASDYAPFRDAGIPEVVDLNVLPDFRRRGVASAILDAAEAAIAARARDASREPIAGIGVGLYPSYGDAQRLYVRRGYVPDGRGVCYDGEQLAPMAPTVNDDSLNLYLTRRLTGA